MAKNTGLNKMGEGFDKEEFASPVYVGPANGQDGYQPMNPEVDSPRDPLGYRGEQGDGGKGRRRY